MSVKLDDSKKGGAPGKFHYSLVFYKKLFYIKYIESPESSDDFPKFRKGLRSWKISSEVTDNTDIEYGPEINFDERRTNSEDDEIIELMHPSEILLTGDYHFRIKHKNAMGSEEICRFGFNTAFLDKSGK